MMSATATTWASGGVIEVMVVALPSSSVGCGLHDLLYHSARSCLLACLLGTIVIVEVVVLTSSIIVLASALAWRFLL